MRTSSQLLIGGVAVGVLAVIAGCGSSGSASTSLGNPFGGGGAGSGGNVSVPTLPGGLPGIGSSSSFTGPGATLDACTVMSQSNAAQFSGASAIAKVSGTNAGGVSECIYADTSSGAAAFALIENLPGVSVGAAEMQAALAAAPHANGGQTQSVSGLGDQAIKDVQPHSATVAFAKGSTLVILAVSGSTRTGDSIEPDLESLGHQIAGQV